MTLYNHELARGAAKGLTTNSTVGLRDDDVSER